MHSFYPRITAALCAGMLAATCLPPLPAASAETPYTPVSPVLETFTPDGDDAVSVMLPKQEHVDVRITRIDSAGNDEILYESNEKQADRSCLYFPLEPGDYKLSVSMEPIKYAPVKRTYTEQLSIPEPDSDDYTGTEYRYVISLGQTEDTDEALPEILTREESIQDQVRYTESALQFKRYDIMQGDYNGDGTIAALDAQMTLTAYAAELTGDTEQSVLTPAQLAACDIDGNGSLSAIDAQWILIYYLESILGEEPSWPYSTDVRDEAYLVAFGTYLEEENAVEISWIGSDEPDTVDILYSADGEAYTVETTVSDTSTYLYPITEDFASVYLKVAYTDEDGNTVESTPFFVDVNEDGITVDYPDTDGDGIADLLEGLLSTDPTKKDTDNDGLNDGQELNITGSDPTVYDSVTAGISDAEADCDGDGLSNIDEITRGTNPLLADTDSDGLNDSDEISVHQTDPLLADTDGDSLDDGFEVRYGLDPLSVSTDGIADAERQIEQNFTPDSTMLQDVNSEESPYDVSVTINTAGDAEKGMTVEKSGYSESLKNDAQIGGIIDLTLSDFLNTESVHLEYSIKEAYRENTLNKYSQYGELQGIKRLSVFRYYEEIGMMLPVETQYDLEKNIISADVTEAGTYCVVDLEVWFDLFDLEPEEIEAAYAEEQQPETPDDTVTQSIQGGAPAAEVRYTVPKSIDPVQLYVDTNPYTHRNASPIDLVFILQTSGPDFAYDIYEYELDVLEKVVDYVFRNYSNVRVHVVRYDADRAAAVNFGRYTYCTNATAFSNGIRALSYTTDESYCPTKPAFQKAASGLMLRNSVNTYFYHMHNGNNLYELDYDGIVLANANIGIFSQVLPEGYYFNDDSYPAMLHDEIVGNGGIDITLSSNTVQEIVAHIADNIDNDRERTEYDALLGSSLQKVTLRTALSSTLGTDTDYDTLSDWEETKNEYIQENPNGTVELPTIDTLISAAEIDLSVLLEPAHGNPYGESTMLSAIRNRKVLPCKSDPTKKDSDDDGLLDAQPVYYNGKPIAPRDPRPFFYTGPEGLWKEQIYQMQHGVISHEYDGSGLEIHFSTKFADALVKLMLKCRGAINKYGDEIRWLALKVKDHFEGDTVAGAYILNFVKDENGIAYHAQPDTWQRSFGYNALYDDVFRIGSYMNYGRMDFDYDGDTYSIWAWKGDYWNLQTGAEVGLYIYNSTYSGTPHYDVVNFEVPMTLSLYNNLGGGSYDNIYNWVPDVPQWWVTGFNPSYPHPNPQVMVSVACIDLSDHSDLFDAIYDSEKYDLIDNSVKFYDQLKSYHVIPDEATQTVWIQWYN